MPKAILDQETDNKVEHLPPHVVLLWNSDVHTPEFVVNLLMEVCKMSKDEAVKATLEVHEEGKSVVFRGHLELCELKVEQIQTFRDELAIKAGAPNIPLEATIAAG